MRKLVVLLTFFCGHAFVIPCVYAQSESDNLISAVELQNLLKADSSLILIDVRTPEEYALGHLVDALNIDYYKSFEDSIKHFDKNAKYYLYCRSGSRSGKSMKIMGDLGFSHVYSLTGGIMDWKEQGYPVNDH